MDDSDIRDFTYFMNEIENRFPVISKTIFNIIDEIKKEEFLTD